MAKRIIEKAPAYIKGLRPTTPEEMIKQAGVDNSLKALMSQKFALWAQFAGIEVDGHKFDFDTHRYLLPIYMDDHKHVVWMKAAQLGATIYMLLRLLWMCRYMSIKAALYFPTGEGVEVLSKDRLAPLIRSNPELYENLSDAVDTQGLKQIHNIEERISSLYMLYVGGRASKDSVPLDVIAFDEVRLIDPRDIDQCIERIAHSSHKYKIMMSTAGLPNCFPGDTAIIVKEKNTGLVTRRTFKELEHTYEKYQALSYNKIGGRRQRWRNITGFVNQGEQDVVEVKLWGGQTIKCTPDHRFAQLSRDGTIVWTSIKNVKNYEKRFGGKTGPRDGVLTVNKVKETLPNKWDEFGTTSAPYDLLTFKIVGLFVAEGSLERKEITIWQSPEGREVRELVVQWAVLNGLNYRENDGGVAVSLVTRPDLVKVFVECGHKAPNKVIPESFLQGDSAQSQALIDGIVLGDGHRRENGNKGGSGRLYDIYTTSTKLVKQLNFVGLKIGKPFQVSKRPPREGDVFGQKLTGHFDQYQLSYNPNSFRNKEVATDLGQCAIGSVVSAGREEVFDISVDKDNCFVLAETGALVHNCDIHRKYIEGTQNVWTVKCGCTLSSEEGFVPSETFPDCIVEYKGEVYLRCPKCKYRIYDPQNGAYVARNPGADIHSYSVSQLISKYISPKEIWEHYKSTTHMREFYNAKLGMPYVDAESRPVSPDVFDKCVNMDLKWGRDSHNKKGNQPRAMGVDHGSNYCYAVIMERGRDGKKNLVHLELIEATNPRYFETNEATGEEGPTTPFKRLYELMKEYNVQMCVVDAMPNINEAYEFGRHFPRKVFLAHYKDAGQDMVLWTDRTKTKEAIRKGSKDIRYKWQVLLKRYDAMDYALRLYAEGAIQVPPIKALKQFCRNEATGKFETEFLCERFRDHLGRLVREQESLDKEGENTGRYKHKWVYMGSDPHFAHANLYCLVALERLKNRAMFAI